MKRGAARLLGVLLLTVVAACAHRRQTTSTMGCLVPIPPPPTIAIAIAAVPNATPPSATAGALVLYLRWANDSLARSTTPAGAAVALRSGQRVVSSRVVSSEPHSGPSLGPTLLVAAPGAYHLVVQRQDAAPLDYPLSVRAGYSDTVRVALEYVRNVCPQ